MQRQTGRNVLMDSRFAEGNIGRLRAFAADLMAPTPTCDAEYERHERRDKSGLDPRLDRAINGRGRIASDVLSLATAIDRLGGAQSTPTACQGGPYEKGKKQAVQR
jgi:hypothetical protein